MLQPLVKVHAVLPGFKSVLLSLQGPDMAALHFLLQVLWQRDYQVNGFGQLVLYGLWYSVQLTIERHLAGCMGSAWEAGLVS